MALSLISSLKDKALSDDVVAFGEVGLAGEIRAVTNAEARISEAVRLGFQKIVLPYQNFRSIPKRSDVELIGVRMLRDAYEALG